MTLKCSYWDCNKEVDPRNSVVVLFDGKIIAAFCDGFCLDQERDTE